jgi:hypothetical protein
MSQYFNDRMHAVNQRLKRYEIRDRINEHDREPIKPAQSAQDKTINNLLYFDQQDKKNNNV